jgi:hypothetical protein
MSITERLHASARALRTPRRSFAVYPVAIGPNGERLVVAGGKWVPEPTEPTATGPKGERLVVRDGAWVPAA